MIPVGLGLLLVPETILSLWPWTLTPLTARAIGAWSLALGIAAAHSIWENDWARVHVATVSYTVFSVFELIALVRYPSQVNWSSPAAWFYVIFLISVLIVGLYGWRESARHASPSDTAAARAS
jgi:hypothetical protein